MTRQEEHAATAKAIVEALAAQADAAAKQPQQQQQGGPDAKTLSAAADEVRHADAAMGEARGTLVKARDTKTSSESLLPATKVYSLTVVAVAPSGASGPPFIFASSSFEIVALSDLPSRLRPVKRENPTYRSAATTRNITAKNACFGFPLLI